MVISCSTERSLHRVCLQLTVLFCMAQPKTFISSTRHSCLHMSVPLHLRLSLPHLQPLRSRCRSINTAVIHRMRSMALWPKQPLQHNVHNIRLKKEGDRNVDQLSNLYHVTTNAHYSQNKAQLYIFEDNEAVIKMITKGRSPTVRGPCLEPME